MSARIPAFPEASTDFIKELLQAFKSRSKAIKHAVKEWKIEMSADDDGERLDLDFVDYQDLQVRLTAWQDGVLWFRACKSASRKLGGWEFSFAFHLCVNRQSVPLIVRAFERSRHLTNRKAAMECWKDFDPRTDYTVG